jgi:hypothetical protein
LAQVVEICPYDPAWPSLFAALGVRLRNALGSVALRIDHIGSTAVPGLAAKPSFQTARCHLETALRMTRQRDGAKDREPVTPKDPPP